ncbi:recombinase family protein [Klebsiella pneumoniae]|uniref:recombinase family protein n=1 Tax=Klebsiella pneumoniae TaxID=573 RepID=UPI003976035E
MEQDALRAKNRLKEFAAHNGHRIAGWYVENASGASLERPELTRMLSDMEVSVQREPSGHNLRYSTKWCPPNK